MEEKARRRLERLQREREDMGPVNLRAEVEADDVGKQIDTMVANDLVLQLRKRGVNKVLLAGMSANLCTESHLRELQEQGFEVAVAWDATGAAQLPQLDGMAAALVNFRMLASETITTHEAVRRLRGSAATR